MKKLISLFLLLVTFSMANGQQRSKLLVGLVIDQMRADYLTRYWSKFGNEGFKRLMTEGYACRNAHYNYAPTYTGPGHASIYTGTTPSVHGIIANDWFDKKGGSMYCAEDAAVSGLGTETDAGKMSPKNLLSETLGDAVKISNQFRGKVIGVSIKDRGAVLPAGHSADGAYWFDYDSGNFISSSYYNSALPQWVKDFNAQSKGMAYASKPWKPLLPIESYTESTQDDTPYESALDGSDDPTFPYDIKRAIEEKGWYAFAKSPYGNSILTDLALEALQAEELGVDEYTDMLAISYSTPDILGHAYGPQSIEIEDMYLRLDREIARLLSTLDNTVGENQYSVFLTADHAVAQVPQYLKDHKIPVDYVSKEAVKTAIEACAATHGTGLIASYSNQQIFFDHAQLKALGVDAVKLAEDLERNLEERADVMNVMTAKHLMKGNLNAFENTVANGWHPKRSGDLYVQYPAGWLQSEQHTGTSHGTVFNYDSHVPLIFFGAGIEAGQTYEYVDITQIAPTVALAIGIQFPSHSNTRAIVGALAD